RVREVAVDWHVFAFTACLSVMVAIVFGLTPALQASRTDVNYVLKSGGRSSAMFSNRARSLLVVSEVALSLLLLIGAGLLVRSFMKLQSVNTGIDAKNLISIRMSLPAYHYSQPEAINAFIDRLIREVRALSGVQSVSMGSVLPLSGMNVRADFTIVGRPPATQEEQPAAQNRWIAPDYFRTMGIPVLRGREFTSLDTGRSQAVVVIDQELAQRN